MPARSACADRLDVGRRARRSGIADGVEADAEAGADQAGPRAVGGDAPAPARPSASQRLTASHMRRRIGRAEEQRALEPPVDGTRRRDRAPRRGRCIRRARHWPNRVRRTVVPEHRAVVGRKQQCRCRRRARRAPTTSGPARRSALARQRKAAIGERHRRDRGRRRLGFRLAGERIGAPARPGRPTRADDAVSSLQWIGTNSEPRCCPAIDARPSARRRRARRHAREAAVASRPCAAASGGCTSTNGSGRCSPRRGLGRCASWCATGRARGRC